MFELPLVREAAPRLLLPLRLVVALLAPEDADLDDARFAPAAPRALFADELLVRRAAPLLFAAVEREAVFRLEPLFDAAPRLDVDFELLFRAPAAAVRLVPVEEARFELLDCFFAPLLLALFFAPAFRFVVAGFFADALLPLLFFAALLLVEALLLLLFFAAVFFELEALDPELFAPERDADFREEEDFEADADFREEEALRDDAFRAPLLFDPLTEPRSTSFEKRLFRLSWYTKARLFASNCSKKSSHSIGCSVSPPLNPG